MDYEACAREIAIEYEFGYFREFKKPTPLPTWDELADHDCRPDMERLTALIQSALDAAEARGREGASARFDADDIADAIQADNGHLSAYDVSLVLRELAKRGAISPAPEKGER